MGLARDIFRGHTISSNYNIVSITYEGTFEMFEDEDYRGYKPPVYGFNEYELFLFYFNLELGKIYNDKFVIEVYECGLDVEFCFRFGGEVVSKETLLQLIDKVKKITHKECELYKIYGNSYYDHM